MPDVVRSCEMKAISSKEDWTWQRMLTSCPQNGKHEMAAGFGRTGGCSDTSLDYWLVEMSVRKRCGMWLGCESARLRRAVICNLWYDASGVEVQKTIRKRSAANCLSIVFSAGGILISLTFCRPPGNKVLNCPWFPGRRGNVFHEGHSVDGDVGDDFLV